MQIENVGKPAKLLVENNQGEQAWIATRIVGCMVIRNADHSEKRYQARLTLGLNGARQTVQATLNDRSAMSHRLLLGRDFLHHGYVVDVSRDPNPF